MYYLNSDLGSRLQIFATTVRKSQFPVHGPIGMSLISVSFSSVRGRILMSLVGVARQNLCFSSGLQFNHCSEVIISIPMSLALIQTPLRIDQFLIDSLLSLRRANSPFNSSRQFNDDRIVFTILLPGVRMLTS